MGVAWINVKDKGATGDGSTNDKAAFDSALDDLSNGGVLYVPPGIYMLESAFVIDTDNIHILGDGPDAAIIKHQGTTAHILIDVSANSPNSRNNIRLSNLTLDGNKSGITSDKEHVLSLTRVKNFSIENVIIKNSIYSNVYINGDDSGSDVFSNGIIKECYLSGADENNLLIVKDTRRVIVSDCYFGSNGENKSSISISQSCHYITIKNCFIENAGSNGINVIETSSTNTYHHFENNYIKDSGTQGILTQKANRIRISGNTIFNSGKNGINTDSCKECIVEGNLCYNSNGDEATDACGILVGGDSGEDGPGDRNIISNNRCFGNNNAGIAIVGSCYNIIDGNTCFNNGKRTQSHDKMRCGIVLKECEQTHKRDCLGNVVIGNNCFDIQATKTQKYGIYEYDDGNATNKANKNMVIGNRCYNNVTKQVEITGSDSKSINNITSAGTSVTAQTTITLPDTSDTFLLTATSSTSVTSINASWAGRIVTFYFDNDKVTIVDGSNLKLNSNFSSDTNHTLQLVCNGTNWFEISRSAN